MDEVNWKSIAIVNMIITVISLIALVFVSISFKTAVNDMNKNESSRTRIEVKYISKTIDGVEFIFPSSGIIRDTETNDDMVIDRFDIIVETTPTLMKKLITKAIKVPIKAARTTL